MDILTDVEIAIDPNLNIFKANALRQLGKLDESAESLCEVVNSNSYKYTAAMELLSEIIEKIDYYQAKLDGFPKMIKDSYKLAIYCRDYSNAGDSRHAALMLAEISTFVTEKEQRKLFLASELVNSLAKQDDASDISLLRCRARLLTAQGKFAEAARLWAQIAKIQQNNTNGAYQRTWKWWRAKFYELDCFAKIPQTEKQDILYTIEVLENSFTDIPPLWAEKLDLLKQKCRYTKK
jgi:tetratricopeptide (TPR) repeat protein